MAILYTTPGYVELRSVSITGGGFGASGSTLTWNFTSVSNTDTQVSDENENGTMEAGVDEWIVPTDASAYIFTGYTITSGGVEYPIFTVGGLTYFVPIDEDGVGQTTIPDSGTSNAYQASAMTYLCFAEGTLVAMPDRDRAVEELRVGDLIATNEGRAVPVKWIGRQTISTRFGPAERLRPVRVRAGALGDGLPNRDLVLTSDHALLIDGLLINVGALVNGDSIDYVPLRELGESYTVYHIETENHDVILAEGAPAETYIDYVARRAFDNYAEYVELYREERTIPELEYPRISSARMVPQVLQERLSASSAA